MSFDGLYPCPGRSRKPHAPLLMRRCCALSTMMNGHAAVQKAGHMGGRRHRQGQGKVLLSPPPPATSAPPRRREAVVTSPGLGTRCGSTGALLGLLLPRACHNAGQCFFDVLRPSESLHLPSCTSCIPAPRSNLTVPRSSPILTIPHPNIGACVGRPSTECLVRSKLSSNRSRTSKDFPTPDSPTLSRQVSHCQTPDPNWHFFGRSLVPSHSLPCLAWPRLASPAPRMPLARVCTLPTLALVAHLTPSLAPVHSDSVSPTAPAHDDRQGTYPICARSVCLGPVNLAASWTPVARDMASIWRQNA